MKIRCARTVAIIALLSASSAAFAQVPWSNPSGSGSFFSWANGQSLFGLYSDPQIVGGSTFLFNPSNFVASATNGAQTTTSDTLSFDLFADAGFLVSGIQIIELGSFSTTGDATVDINASLSIDDISAGASRNNSANMFFNPTPPFGGATGTFQGNVLADLSFGASWTELHIEFSNNLIAISTPGNAATIRLDIVGAQIAIMIVPAPATAVLGLFGFAAVGRRRR